MITQPTDGCPNCVRGSHPPIAAIRSGDNLLCLYRCCHCGHHWPCWWGVRGCGYDVSSVPEIYGAGTDIPWSQVIKQMVADLARGPSS